MSNNPYCIFINGPSSSGKTTLTHAIQELSLIPFLHTGIDKVIGMMPKKSNDWNIVYKKNDTKKFDGFWFEERINEIDQTKDIVLMQGSYGTQISDLLHNISSCILNNKHNLIIDEVVSCSKRFLEWKKILKPYKTCFVGLTCPDALLEEREKNRKDRVLGSAITQNKQFHTHKTYDLFYDTSINPAQEIAENILKYLDIHFKI